MPHKQLIKSTFDFPSIIENNLLYVDKTEFLWKLIAYNEGQFFLSRPRRFGKSLTISTLEAIFQGRKELFKGLAIYDKDYDWKVYPVIHLDFINCASKTPEELTLYLWEILKNVARQYSIQLDSNVLGTAFENMINNIAGNGKVVILIDEYDKPVLENMTNPKIHEILDVLRGFYCNIKKTVGKQRFALLTGVSQFSHMSIFSAQNNMTDITLMEEYAGMLGFTQEELLAYFGDRMEDAAKASNINQEVLLKSMQLWYDGYRFSQGETRVYNPVSITRFFDNNGRFDNYWADTGTPAFLYKLALQTSFDFEASMTRLVSSDIFKSYDVENPNPIGILWQTGYLTIKDVIQQQISGAIPGLISSPKFRLDFPNYEVKHTFNLNLLKYYTKTDEAIATPFLDLLVSSIYTNDLKLFMETLQSFFANIQYDIKSADERYYQTIFFVIFLLIGMRVEAESRTSNGRIDAVIRTSTRVYVFEFKLNKSARAALTQIMNKEYYLKYKASGLPITLIGANFNKAKGQLTSWKELAVDAMK